MRMIWEVFIPPVYGAEQKRATERNIPVPNTTRSRSLAEGFYRVRAGIDQAISRGLACAPYADLLWCETAKPYFDEARKFASGCEGNAKR